MAYEYIRVSVSVSVRVSRNYFLEKFIANFKCKILCYFSTDLHDFGRVGKEILLPFHRAQDDANRWRVDGDLIL